MTRVQDFSGHVRFKYENFGLCLFDHVYQFRVSRYEPYEQIFKVLDIPVFYFLKVKVLVYDCLFLKIGLIKIEIETNQHLCVMRVTFRTMGYSTHYKESHISDDTKNVTIGYLNATNFIFVITINNVFSHYFLYFMTT